MEVIYRQVEVLDMVQIDLTYQVQEVAYFVPGAPKLSPAGAIQLNDVFVDEQRIVYTMDRFTGGLYILEMNV